MPREPPSSFLAMRSPYQRRTAWSVTRRRTASPGKDNQARVRVGWRVGAAERWAYGRARMDRPAMPTGEPLTRRAIGVVALRYQAARRSAASL